ncbi:hypothetical protein [Desulfonatronum thiosulfatophilum]|uniref:hypothetical protein n=1 Tax=Desulfonatronum thiosulfatophilum TaxID=617002 RepID=UPI00111468A0|nr:hypothetical protein [Desulfonatronum thiosulfatophilum]
MTLPRWWGGVSKRLLMNTRLHPWPELFRQGVLNNCRDQDGSGIFLAANYGLPPNLAIGNVLQTLVALSSFGLKNVMSLLVFMFWNGCCKKKELRACIIDIPCIPLRWLNFSGNAAPSIIPFGMKVKDSSTCCIAML